MHRNPFTNSGYLEYVQFPQLLRFKCVAHCLSPQRCEHHRPGHQAHLKTHALSDFDADYLEALMSNDAKSVHRFEEEARTQGYVRWYPVPLSLSLKNNGQNVVSCLLQRLVRAAYHSLEIIGIAILTEFDTEALSWPRSPVWCASIYSSPRT